MISVAPAPRLTNLLKALIPIGTGRAMPELATLWASDFHNAIWFSRATGGLETIARWDLIRASRDSTTLWVPDYFCNEALEPLRGLGVNIVFYPIAPTLSPDWVACEKLADSVPPKLFVLVHYFGWPSDAERAAQFCRQTGAILIEDASHVLCPIDGIGRSGDFVLFSPYKHLAIPDGGLLAVKASGQISELRRLAQKTVRARTSVWRWVLRKLLQAFLPGFLFEAAIRARRLPFDVDPPTQGTESSPMSGLAARLIGEARQDFSPIAQHRRMVFNALADIEWPYPCRPFIRAASDPVSPYRFILNCGDSGRARSFYEILAQAGCMVESWPDLPPEIRAQSTDHATAVDLRNRLIFIPVHQSVDVDELTNICREASRQFATCEAVRQ